MEHPAVPQDEASAESFPASDPPASHASEPGHDPVPRSAPGLLSPHAHPDRAGAASGDGPRRRALHGAAAGAAAAACWLAAEPLLVRVTRPGSYREARLLGRLLSPHGRWRAVGAAAHIGTGALFGAAFRLSGRHGVAQALLAAGVENAAVSPSFIVLSRLHPDVRSGEWRPLLRDPRVLAHEALGHVAFGLVLGALTRRRPNG